MRYTIKDMTTFTSIASWVPLTHEWDGGKSVCLTLDEAALFGDAVSSPFDVAREVANLRSHINYARILMGTEHVKYPVKSLIETLDTINLHLG